MSDKETGLDLNTDISAAVARNVIAASQQAIHKDTFNKEVYRRGMKLEGNDLDREVSGAEIATQFYAAGTAWLLWTLAILAVWFIFANQAPDFMPGLRDLLVFVGICGVTVIYGLLAFNAARNNPNARYWAPPTNVGPRGV